MFGRWGAAHAICNCLYGVQLVFNEDMAKAFARAVNDWIAKEWLVHRFLEIDHMGGIQFTRHGF